MKINQCILDNIVGYSIIMERYPYENKWKDKVTVSYYKTNGLCKKRKYITDEAFFFLRVGQTLDNRKGDSGPECDIFIKLLKGHLPDNKKESSFKRMKELEEEYLNRDDDFSMGVIFAIEEIKKSLEK